MNPLRIDYAVRPRRSWASYALLCAGALLAFDVSYSEWRASEEARSKTSVANAARQGPQASSARKEGWTLEDELKQANQIIGQLSMPWPTLFRALEKAHTDDVALLTLQPDAQRRRLQVTGEAKAYPQVLSYIARLKSEALLDNVHLVSTEVREDDAQRPILFSVSASWARIE